MWINRKYSSVSFFDGSGSDGCLKSQVVLKSALILTKYISLRQNGYRTDDTKGHPSRPWRLGDPDCYNSPVSRHDSVCFKRWNLFICYILYHLDMHILIKRMKCWIVRHFNFHFLIMIIVGCQKLSVVISVLYLYLGIDSWHQQILKP